MDKCCTNLTRMTLWPAGARPGTMPGAPTTAAIAGGMEGMPVIELIKRAYEKV